MKNTVIVIISTLIFCYIFANTAISKSVKNDEKVIFIPTYGKIVDNRIETVIHMWIFEPEENSAIRNMTVAAIRKLMPDDDEEFRNSVIFNERLKSFMVDNERNKKLKITMNGNEYELNASNADGHSLTTIQIPNDGSISKKKYINIRLIPESVDGRNFESYIMVENPDGVAVISDIDDTIKISNVLDKRELIKNTFVRPFRQVNKMADFYSSLEKNNVSFHYVSGSPWQLYEPLSEFMLDNGFPKGSFHLKKFRIKDKSFIDFIINDQKEHKLTVISGIIKDFPKKQFILIGDSGEMDAEIYREIYSRFPENVSAVFIRDAGNLDSEKSRFEEIKESFKDIKFSFFRDGQDLLKIQSDIISNN